MPLTALKVRHAGPGRHADIQGLYLVVRDSGTRSWMLRIQRHGCRRDFGLGSVDDVSLADARLAVADYRRMLRNGLDPVKELGLRRKAAPTFEKVARDCFEAMKGGWKNGKHNSWLPSLENHVFPIIGRTPIDAVDSVAVLGVLEPIWLKIPDTARRILQRIGTTLDYAHIKGLVPEEISLRSVTRGLPRQSRQVTHLAAMPYAEVPSFMKRLVALENSVGRDALKLTVLTAARSNETRFATWGEFDLERGIWAIPGSRMKMKELHVVPLSSPAVAILKRLRDERLALGEKISSDTPVFVGSTGKAISDITMAKAMRNMKVMGVTVHGFRSSFTDWAAERTDFPKEIADKALAHKIPNAVEAAYRRTDFFDKRRVLMDQWAEFVTGGAAMG
ncbi:MAG TPA: integrase arm-type DNA-binding domain-containing protein [Sphingomonadaceae bacterium]|nr:integrase arm-type DNA-binding domain-containing protein [Sphingomonadaceae bacterium]